MRTTFLVAAAVVAALFAATPAVSALKSEWTFVGQMHGEPGTCVIALERVDDATKMVPEQSRELILVWTKDAATLELRSDEWQDDGRQAAIQDDVWNGEHRVTVTVRQAKGKPVSFELVGKRPARIALFIPISTKVWEDQVKDARSISVTFAGYKHQSPWFFDRIDRDDTMFAFRNFNQCVIREGR
ncbi:hypothetical protein [Bradyrhizobium sp. UFLA05-112]